MMRVGSVFATENDMPMDDLFLMMLIAVSIGWIAVAAVRSNRRHGTSKMPESQEGSRAPRAES